MGNLRQVQGVTLAPKLGPGMEETLRCQRGAEAYFRIRVMVSFRSFPWKGREPVSISNCRGQGSVQALVPSPMPPTSSHPSHSAPGLGVPPGSRTASAPPHSVSQTTRNSARGPKLGRRPAQGWGLSLESFQGRKLQLGGG